MIVQSRVNPETEEIEERTLTDAQFEAYCDRYLAALHARYPEGCP